MKQEEIKEFIDKFQIKKPTKAELIELIVEEYNKKVTDLDIFKKGYEIRIKKLNYWKSKEYEKHNYILTEDIKPENIKVEIYYDIEQNFNINFEAIFKLKYDENSEEYK